MRSAETLAERRALRRLNASGVVLTRVPAEPHVFGVFPDADRRRRPLAKLDEGAVRRLVSDGAIAPLSGNDNVFELTDAGRARLRRAARDGADAFRAQHQDRAAAPIDEASPARGGVEINLTESPLAWLARRSGANGDKLLSVRELAAGERLRVDYHRAQFIGRLTSDWTAAPQSSGARGPGEGALNVGESAVAARDRIAAALSAVDDQLEGVLTAVCLEGRGLDDIERGFGWPRRSGKVVLKMALSRLANHYGMPSDPPNAPSRPPSEP